MNQVIINLGFEIIFNEIPGNAIKLPAFGLTTKSYAGKVISPPVYESFGYINTETLYVWKFATYAGVPSGF